MTALYGGSFDPPHLGHQMACLYLLEALGAAEVVLVPTSSHAFGKRLAPFPHRLAMCRAMAEPFAGKVTVSPIEDALGGTSTTYATLQALEAEMPGRRWAIVVGADLVADLPRWREADALFARAGLVVIGRGGCALRPDDHAFPPKPWLAGPGVDLPQLSSSGLRAKPGGPAAWVGHVPSRVLAYVHANGLYGSPFQPRTD